MTARWSFFLLFWPAYVGSAMAKLSGPRFSGWRDADANLVLLLASSTPSSCWTCCLAFSHLHLARRWKAGSLLFFSRLGCFAFISLCCFPYRDFAKQWVCASGAYFARSRWNTLLSSLPGRLYFSPAATGCGRYVFAGLSAIRRNACQRCLFACCCLAQQPHRS